MRPGTLGVLLMRTLLQFTGLAFVLLSQLAFAGGRGGVPEPDGSVARGMPAVRAFYVFSADDVEHQARARQLEQLVRRYAERLQATGVVRPRRGDFWDPASLEDYGARHGLTYPLLGVQAARLQARIVDAAEQRRDGSGDYLVLLDASEPVQAEGGSELERLRSLLGPGDVGTDVEENTWGKIKVLFQ